MEGRRGDVSRNRSAERNRASVERNRSERRVEGSTIEQRRSRSSESRRTVDERRSRSAEGRRYERRDDRRDEGRTYERHADRNNDSRYRNNERRGSDRYRNDGRYERNRGGSRYENRRPYYAHGRVSRYARYGGGYRVWVVGAPYPFYVPLAHWHHDRFRVGLTIRLGGYYNPLGYYDYWDGYRDGYYNSGYRAHSEADFRGEVESVDYRRDSFVVRNEDTGNFITVVLRDRRETLPRAGDFVAVRGDWTTQGYFRAYDVDFLDY